MLREQIDSHLTKKKFFSGFPAILKDIGTS